MASTALYIRDFRSEIPGGFQGSAWKFPEIIGENAHGKETTWSIEVKIVDIDGTPVEICDEYYDTLPPGLSGWIKVSSGLRGGKTRESSPTIIRAGKNIGKASATNPWTQALREAYSLYNKQLKKAAPRQRDGVVKYLPMLAQVLSAQKTRPNISPENPGWVQRKYNGVRMVATTAGTEGGPSVLLYSRRGNDYPGFNVLRGEISKVLSGHPGVYLDGEVYKHGVALQDISGVARREGEDPGDYDYMVYDCFIPGNSGLIYTQRKEILERILSTSTTHVKLVETFPVEDQDDIDDLYKRFIAEGFEGAMLRLDKPYQYSVNERHSKWLLKIKPTNDAEYQIVGWTTGAKGKAAGALMIVCEVDIGGNRVEFPVTPAMKLPDRIALAKLMGVVETNGATHFDNHYRGKPLVVYYDELSKDGIPQRARTKMEIRTWD